MTARLVLAVLGLAVGTVGVILILGSNDAERSGTSSTSARVAFVVDGDTLEIGSGEHVRLIGIDTPERGQCGYRRAADALRRQVDGHRVTLVNPESVQDEDVHGRLLRYVDRAGRDAGYDLVRTGLARARYDSRDGYDPHPRERRYRAADRRVGSPC